MPPPWITYSPLLPLSRLLLASGLYLFVLRACTPNGAAGGRAD